MPATSQGPPALFVHQNEFEAEVLVDERGCRRDIRQDGLIRGRLVLLNRPGRRVQAALRSLRVLRIFVGRCLGALHFEILTRVCSPTPSSYEEPPHCRVLLGPSGPPILSSQTLPSSQVPEWCRRLSGVVTSRFDLLRSLRTFRSQSMSHRAARPAANFGFLNLRTRRAPPMVIASPNTTVNRSLRLARNP
jgi:hypothetical protein